MKKTVPLSVLKTIEPILEKIDRKKFLVDRSGNSAFKVLDIERGSDFFFELTNCEAGQDKVVVNVQYRPQNANIVTLYKNRIYLEILANEFTHWSALIDGYQSVITVFDDPIVEKYEKEFFAEFEILDDDADKVSFDFQKQLLIDTALNDVIQSLESKKDQTNEHQIAELVKEAEEIKNTLTELTKRETASKISKLFAKIRKGGIKLIKDPYPILQKEIIGQAVKGLMEFASNPHLPGIVNIIT